MNIELRKPSVKNIPDAELAKVCREIVFKALFRAGQAKDDTTIELMANELKNDVLNDFSTLTIDELRRVVENGLKHAETPFINNITLHKVIQTYYSSPHRKKPVENNYEMKHDPEQLEREYWDVIRKAFAEYKSTGILNLEFPSYLYKRLEDMGHIVPVEVKRTLIEKAKVDYLNELKIKRLTIGGIQRMQVKQAIQRLEAGEMNDDDNAAVVALAKLGAVKMIFDKLEKI